MNKTQCSVVGMEPPADFIGIGYTNAQYDWNVQRGFGNTEWPLAGAFEIQTH